jgi:DNA-binding response OmpR family regulator
LGKKILAVDDDERIVRLVQINLTRAGYSVTTAPDGAEALRMIAADRPDLIVLDVMMPGMSGFEVIRTLRADPATENIPVILLTARTGDTDIADGWYVGADCYLPKPFSPTELLSFVGRLIP